MSGNRPHNGFVLECTGLQRTLISALGPSQLSWRPILANTNSMLAEQHVVGKEQASTPSSRFPVYVLLDEVTDPQNLGSIIRTAYFLGASGVILSQKNCAQITPVVVKVASGATELMPLYHVDSTVTFIRASKRNDWTVLATVGKNDSTGNRSCSIKDLRNLARKKPVCLVLGSEGFGLRTLVKKECSMTVTIPAAKGVHAAVDSLNVGSAASTLLSCLLLE